MVQFVQLDKLQTSVNLKNKVSVEVEGEQEEISTVQDNMMIDWNKSSMSTERKVFPVKCVDWLILICHTYQEPWKIEMKLKT